MATHAYDQSYLNRAARTLGNMLHDAVVGYNLDGAEFLKLFVQSGVARQFEDGNPRYIAGKSGLELFLEVMERATGKVPLPKKIETFDRSPEYWLGWVLAHYQWKSGRKFCDIIAAIPYRELIGQYATLHEADINKCYEVLDANFAGTESSLKKIRRSCGLTQEALAKESGVSLNTIKAYERKSKSLSKAQFDTILRLATVLRCDPSDLVEIETRA